MKLIQLLEAANEAKKYVDKDGKVVHRLPRKPAAEVKDEPVPLGIKKRKNRSWDEPSDDALYGRTGYDDRIKLRKKGDKVDRDYIGSILRFAHERDGKLYYYDEHNKADHEHPFATIKSVGTTYKQNPMTGQWHKAETMELHFDSGAIVPATRLGKSFVIVQDYRYKAYVPPGAEKFWSLLRDHNNR